MPGAVFAAAGPAGVINFDDLHSQEIESSYFTMHTDGSITHEQNFTGDLMWVENGAPSNYEVRFDGGSWLDFSTDRTINDTTDVDLRDKWTLATVKSATISLV